MTRAKPCRLDLRRRTGIAIPEPLEHRCDIAIIGGGPAGLAAAEATLGSELSVTIFEAKPSLARKFLMAGKSGLNLSKDEPAEQFLAAFPPEMHPFVAEFDARVWAEGLGEDMFTGSSGRVFPKAMKASPLLRKWLGRLEGVGLLTRWRWTGWDGDDLLFETPGGVVRVAAKAQVFALGGGSWPRLGSDGGWVAPFEAAGVAVKPLKPANIGFEINWSPHFVERFAGEPVKNIALSFGGRRLQGEFVITKFGVEGGVVYTQSAALREADAPVAILDLLPQRSHEDLAKRLARPRAKMSWSNFLRKSVGLSGVKAALLRELAADVVDTPSAVAGAIKGLEMPIGSPRSLAEAISSAGGVSWGALSADLMLNTRPGAFVAGEMLDWEAPTGGYLLSGCLGTGFAAGRGALDWVRGRPEDNSAR